MEAFDRRELLRRAGVAAFAGGLAAVGTRGVRAAGPPLSQLAASLDGDLVPRGAPGYAAARRLRDTRFDGIRPLAIAFCESAEDVARCLTWCNGHGIVPAPRSGGHSYGGYSTRAGGLVVDVSRLGAVALSGTRARIGAGARLIDVYDVLARGGRLIPAGSCPTVGVAGLTLGGGHGFWSRKHGLTCDALAGATVVTGAGEALECGPGSHEDLFWALRGGGGGNFGIVTELRFDTAPATDVATFYVEWRWSDARRALAAWQALAPHAPDALFSVLSLRGGAGLPPRITAGGLMLGGTEVSLRSLIAPLTSAAEPIRSILRERTHMGAVFLYAGGCSSVLACHAVPRDTLEAKSHYARRPLGAEGIATLVHALDALRGHAAPAGGFVLLDAYGGAINRVAPAATAFVHRRELFSLQYGATWAPGSAAGLVSAGLAWLRGLHAAMRPHTSGFAYQNYVDPELAGWQHAYYGENLPRLAAARRRYDPGGLLRFAQGIPARA